MGLQPFTSGDFDLFTPEKTKDPQWDGARLVLKRKLQAWGEEAERRIRRAGGGPFQVQTSLHRPYKFNRYRVDSQRAILTPPPERKRQVRELLGEAFRAETGSGVIQMHLALTIFRDRVETALRTPPQAWWHGLAWGEALQAKPGDLLSLLKGLPEEFLLEVQGRREGLDCGTLEERALRRALGGYRPGEHWVTLRRTHPREGLLEGPEDQEELLLEDLVLLAPIHEFLESYTWRGR